MKNELEVKLLDIRSFSSYTDYLVQRVKKMIKSCRNKEQLFTAINYSVLAADELSYGEKKKKVDWLDYFQPLIFNKGKELGDNLQYPLATKWVARRYNC